MSIDIRNTIAGPGPTQPVPLSGEQDYARLFQLQQLSGLPNTAPNFRDEGDAGAAVAEWPFGDVYLPVSRFSEVSERALWIWNSQLHH
jgi:hypothetical protein